MTILRFPFFLFSVLLLASAVSCQPVQRQEAAPAPEMDSLELPDYDSTEHILVYEGFTSSYNHQTLVPNWVAYELTAEETDGQYTSSSNFSRDPHLKGRQASREDYSRSGWDKGHMVPKADLKWSEKAWWESHYFTNICPQNHCLNGGDWNALERHVRKLARKYGRLYVVCGPVFTDHSYGSIGQAQVQIPDAFFKALLVYADGRYSAIAFVMQNNDDHQPMRKAAMSVDDLESLIGRDLFPALDDEQENRAEAAYDLKVWGL